MLIPHSRYAFEDFIEATSKIHCRERLLETFVEAMRSYGYDRINFSVKFDDRLPEHERGFGIISTYPEDWQKHYQERSFIEIDPVLKCAVASFLPFTWRELERTLPLSRQQVRFLRLGEEAGLHNGMGIPFSGPSSQVAGIALATSTRLADRMTNKDLIAAHCNQFYLCYKRIIGESPSQTPVTANLSAKELEVMRWVIASKTDDEIGDILCISSNTVNYHLRRIYQKLNVHDRLAAVVSAIKSGIINL